MRKNRGDLPIIGWYRNLRVMVEGISVVSIFDAEPPKYEIGNIITFSPYTDIKFEIIDRVYLLSEAKLIVEYTVKEFGEKHGSNYYLKEDEIKPLPTKQSFYKNG